MLYIIGFGIAFFLSVILFSKKNKSQADYILAVWLGVIGIHLLLYYVYVTDNGNNDSLIIPLGSPLPLVHGPLLYLYTTISTSAGRWRKMYALHFLPLVFMYVWYMYVFIVHVAGSDPYPVLSLVQSVLVNLSGMVYVALSIHQLLLYRQSMVHQFSNTERINFNWLLYLIIWIGVIWCLVLFLRQDDVLFAAVVFFVIWLGYFGIKQVSIFNQVKEQDVGSSLSTINDHVPAAAVMEESSPGLVQDGPKKIRYQKSALSETSAQLIHKSLQQVMGKQKVFKNPELTLNELADQLQVHPNNLSQVINSIENKNFYDYINGKRMEEFLELIAKPENKKFTLLSLALECGFNSKAAFNRNFKKMTGLTPSEYIRTKTD